MGDVLDYQRAKSGALRFLSYRPRSIEETRRFLQRKSFSSRVTERVIASLVKLHLLDDAEFASWWTDSRARFRPCGLIKLRSELKRKGVPSEIITQATRFDYLKLARKALEPKAARLTERNPLRRKQKLAAFLQRRGFTWEQIQGVITAGNASL